MSEVYEKAMEAIADVAKAEGAAQIDPPMSVTMPLSAMLATVLAVQIGVKSAEDNINSALRSKSLPNDYDRKELKQLRVALDLLVKAFRSDPLPDEIRAATSGSELSEIEDAGRPAPSTAKTKGDQT